MNKKHIQADIEDVSDKVYSVRLYVTADSPDNLDSGIGQNRRRNAANN